MMRRILLVVVLLIGGVSPVLAQKPTRGLTGERLDLVLTLLPDGSVDVSETIRFGFAEREFEEVNREVSIRRTDGVIDVRALQDGVVVPEGRGPGTVRISTGRTLRVRWRFDDVTDVSRSFTLQYRAMGAVSVANARATLEWAVIPEERRYVIAQARVELRIPPGTISLGGPEMVAEGWSWHQPSSGVWVAEKTNLAIGESAILREVFDAGSLSAAPPQWQSDRDRARQLTPAFIAGALVILVMGTGVLIMMHIQHARPALDVRTILPADAGELPAGVATSLRGGRLQLMPAQSAATVFDLASRGVLTLQQRDAKAFDVVLPHESGVRSRLRPHEQVVFDALWLGAKQGRVDLKAGQTAVTGVFGAYKKAVEAEVHAFGWVDADRERAGTGLVAAGAVTLIVGVIGAVVLAIWLPWAGELALLVPAALALMGAAFLIAGAVLPTLNQQGMREALRWDARRRVLQASIKTGVSDRDLGRWLPFAIGWHLGPAFAKAATTSGAAAVSWLQGAAGDVAGITTIIAATHVSTSSAGGGGVSGGGVAGGGSSGAS